LLGSRLAAAILAYMLCRFTLRLVSVAQRYSHSGGIMHRALALGAAWLAYGCVRLARAAGRLS
jgi:hypothetical protein